MGHLWHHGLDVRDHDGHLTLNKLVENVNGSEGLVLISSSERLYLLQDQGDELTEHGHLVTTCPPDQVGQRHDGVVRHLHLGISQGLAAQLEELLESVSNPLTSCVSDDTMDSTDYLKYF